MRRPAQLALVGGRSDANLILIKNENFKFKVVCKGFNSKKTELEGTLGGNNSDVTYSDSQRGGHYDIAVMSVIDIHDSSRSQDKLDQL